jgi:acyl-CoA thioester hydrolase
MSDAAPGIGLSAVTEIVVPFYDVDAMQVAWHGHYFKYFEQARCALLQRFDYDYPQMPASGYVWPIVEAQVKYVRPARYGQRLQARAELLEWENRLKIGYLITDAASGERLTRGWTIQVAVSAASGELQFETPAVLREKLARC